MRGARTENLANKGTNIIIIIIIIKINKLERRERLINQSYVQFPSPSSFTFANDLEQGDECSKNNSRNAHSIQ
jgi:hypothetical protein